MCSACRGDGIHTAWLVRTHKLELVVCAVGEVVVVLYLCFSKFLLTCAIPVVCIILQRHHAILNVELSCCVAHTAILPDELPLLWPELRYRHPSIALPLQDVLQVQQLLLLCVCVCVRACVCVIYFLDIVFFFSLSFSLLSSVPKGNTTVVSGQVDHTPGWLY